MDIIIKYQLDVMLFMCGMCGILAVMTMITKSLPHKTKFILASMEISSMALLFFDRLAYIYNGDASDVGFYGTDKQRFGLFSVALNTFPCYEIFSKHTYKRRKTRTRSDTVKNCGRSVRHRRRSAYRFSIYRIILHV